MLEEFVKYLTKISTKSSFLLHQQYAAVFEALHEASTPNHDATENNHENQEENYESENEDRLAQMLVEIQEGQQTESERERESEEEESEDESRGIDLIASDNEEHEEEIESESEDDRAFLDDETNEQEVMSFYTRLNVEQRSDGGGEKKWQIVRICYSGKLKLVTTKSFTN